MQPSSTPAPRVSTSSEASPLRKGCFGGLGLVICALFVLMLFDRCTGGGDSPQTSDQDKSEVADFIPLGEKVMALKSAHTRTDVIKRLGKPDSIILPSDTPSDARWRVRDSNSLMFIYRNPGQRLILVDFKNGYFAGADGGVGAPFSDEPLPPDAYLSKLPDRNKFADVWFRDDIASPAQNEFKYVLKGSYVDVGNVGVMDFMHLVKAMYKGSVPNTDAERCLIYPRAATPLSDWRLQQTLEQHLIFGASDATETVYLVAILRNALLDENRTNFLKFNGDDREASTFGQFFFDDAMVFSGWSEFTTREGNSIKVPVFRVVGKESVGN